MRVTYEDGRGTEEGCEEGDVGDGLGARFGEEV